MAADRPLRVLLIGCGRMAGGFDMTRDPALPALTHAGAYHVDSHFTITACVDPDDAARAAFARHWQVPRHAAGLATLGASAGDFDVVSVCSPTSQHAADVEAALRLRPRAIFCEKPVSPRLEDTRRLVEACRAAGVLLAVNHTRRWAPDVVRLRDELVSGRWGALRSISGLYNKGLLNNGGHLVDLVHLLAGGLDVVAAGEPVHDHWPDDPSVSALLRTQAGIPVTFSTAHAADYSVFELQLVTEAGVVSMENGGLRWRIRRSVPSPVFQGYRTLGEAEEVAGTYPMAMARAVEDIREALLHTRPPASNGETALLAQEVCERILSAARPPSTN